MPRYRASLGILLTIVGLCGVGLGALRVSSRLWANAMFSLAAASVLIALVGACYRKGATRAFLVGFASFAGTYLFLAFGPAPFNAWRDLLVTSPALTLLEDKLLNDPASLSALQMTPAARRVGRPELTPWVYWTETDRSNPFSSDSFNRIGHALFSLASGLLGGLICLFLHDTRDRPVPSPSPSP